MTLATVGGILLIIGAFFTMRGDIRTSIILYFLADLAWVRISLSKGDYLGASLVFIGMLLGIVAYFKMQTGRMRRTLDN